MLRNRAFRHFVILFALLTAAAVISGFLISMTAGLLAVSFAAALGAAFFTFTKARYKNIEQISNQIDLVLHNNERLDFGELDEGELSILYGEITKMTQRIREQNDTLYKEKIHLADSLADIAHQLRTPLTSAHLILSLLAHNPDENERKALVRETEELLRRMDWLITSLLKLSRLDAGVVVFQSEPIDLSNLLQASVRPFLISMELHNIEMKTDVPKGIILAGDFGWLSEALQNILKNCIESVGENGKIEAVCTDNPLFTEITVHDSGAGFEQGDMFRLFDKFYRGKGSNATGYGIGLALCKTIITRHGGTIAAKNHPQGGALFVIRFPK